MPRNIKRELAALRRQRRQDEQQRRRALRQAGMAGLGTNGAVGDTAALAAVIGLFVGVPALIGYLGRRASEQEGWVG